MDKPYEPKFLYKGEINFNPFYSNLRGSTEKINLFTLFNSNSILTQLLKTEILNNNNLSIDFSINAKKITQYQNFINFILNFKIQEGLIDIDNTKFAWSKYADFKILDSLIYINKNQLILDGKLVIDVKNYNKIYKYLQTPKNSRSELKKIELNFNYNFDEQMIKFNNVKIDEQQLRQVKNAMKGIILKNDELQNKIYFKRIINQIIAAYAG